MASSSEPSQVANAALGLAQLSLVPSAQHKLRGRGALTALIKAARTADQWWEDVPAGSVGRASIFDAIERLNPVDPDSNRGHASALDSTLKELAKNHTTSDDGEPRQTTAHGQVSSIDLAATRQLRSKGVA
eukprot:SAG31_NODE_18004_length_650_cov_0.840290_1_plen_130_part_10